MRPLLFLMVPAFLVSLWVPPVAAQPAKKKSESAKPAAESAKPPAAADEAKPPIGDGDRLSFDQSKVAAEMNELEDRMFRLADALKSVEPENSSRLMIALKNAREELILHQMKETQDLLRKLELGQALTEEKQLLAKLQRLHDLLLSMDLDFQMRLERLRLLRELLRQLDKAIQEEDREHKLSRDTAGAEKELARWRERQVTLEELIKRQQANVAQGKKLAKLDAAKSEVQNAVGELAKDQQTTRADTKSLAD
ncbi:MAG: hypothetical protein HY000_33865, partial [Planctomycetes bacterium]|nr:hypothetical protein [Planctomycetota bacterium]